MSRIVSNVVSTIIPVWNRARLLTEAVDSVLSQTYRPIEIVIVDDGSSDDTSEIARSLAAKHANEIKYRRQKNQGPGAARELGRQTATGEFIQYLDSDDLLLPNKFDVQVAGLRTRLDCDVAYGKTRYYRIGDKPEDIAHKRTGEQLETMFPGMLLSRWWSTSTPLFTRSICDRAGPWLALRNEEDWEYDCRVASFGVRLHYCNHFVSDTRDHDVQRLCRDQENSATVLKDRAHAHEQIYNHAIRAGIDKGTPEIRHFARELFFLSRQCGRAGLRREAINLLSLASDASSDKGTRTELAVYKVLANLFGWTNMGVMSEKFDLLRSKAP